jgi:hypothetical protein
MHAGTFHKIGLRFRNAISAPRQKEKEETENKNLIHDAPKNRYFYFLVPSRIFPSDKISRSGGDILEIEKLNVEKFDRSFICGGRLRFDSF